MKHIDETTFIKIHTAVENLLLGKSVLAYKQLNEIVNDKQLNIGSVGCWLPKKEEIEAKAKEQALYTKMYGELNQNHDRYVGFMNCVNWYTEIIE